MKEFPLALISHIVTFCDKTIIKTDDKVSPTGSVLKAKLEKAAHKEIQKAIASNETTTNKILYQRKFKKYNNIKYKPKPAFEGRNIDNENENFKKVTNAKILQANIKPTRGIGKTDNTDHNNKPKIQEKLRSLSLTNRYKRQLLHSNIKEKEEKTKQKKIKKTAIKNEK